MFTEDYIAAASLPANFAPIPSKPSKNLLKIKQQKHELLEQKLKKNLQECNHQIEDEIKIEVNNRMDNLNDMNSIEELYETLKNLERKRGEKLCCILSEIYKEMSQNSHLLPNELLNNFEEKILEINKISLGNWCCYAKLRADLKLQLQETLRGTFLSQKIHKIESSKSLPKLAKKIDRCRSQSNELQLFDVTLDTKVPRTMTEIETWSKKIKTTLEYLDMSSKKLINLYKKAVVQVFHRLFDDLQDITEALGEEPEDLRSDIFEEVVQNCDVMDLQNLWSSITDYMENNIKHTYIFLSNCTHLWDSHFERVEMAKNVVLEQVKLTIDRNNKAVGGFEKKIHRVLDQLREECSEKKLEKLLREVFQVLDSIGDLYGTQCEAEIHTLVKYKSAIDSGIALLIAEIEHFLEKNAKNRVIEERRSHFVVVLETRDEHLLPEEIKLCQFQVDAVNNWMFGLWEAIRLYMSTCRKELNTEADTWIENITSKLKKRQEVRLAIHKSRYPRVKTIIYEARLKEIHEHQKNFEDLENKIDRIFEEAQKRIEEFEESIHKLITEYLEDLKKIEMKLIGANNSLRVSSILEETKTKIKKIELEFETKAKEQQLEKEMKRVDDVISHFAKTMTFFVDGGSYNRDEINLYKKKLQILCKTLPKRTKRILELFDKIRTDNAQKLKTTNERILQRVENSKKEFQLKEETCNEVKKLQMALRNFAHEIRFKLHRIQVRCKEGLELDFNEIQGFNLDFEPLLMGFYSKFLEFYEKHKILKDSSSLMEGIDENFRGFRKQISVFQMESVQILMEVVMELMKNERDEKRSEVLEKVLEELFQFQEDKITK